MKSIYLAIRKRDKIQKSFPYLILIFYTFSLIMLLNQKPSVWFDEYFWGVSYLNAPDLPTYLQLVGTQGPEVAPLYISLLYETIKILRISPEEFRYFSIIVSVLTTLFTYNLFKLFFSQRVSLLATLTIVCIPTFLWYSMLLRPHALAFSFSMASLYLFFYLIKYKINNANTSQILLFIIINGLLVFTYYIYVWLVLFETIVFFIVFLYEKSRKVFSLLVINSLCIVLIFFYLTFFSTPSNMAYSLEVDFQSLLGYIFGIRDTEIPYFYSWSPYIYKIVGPAKFSNLIGKICNEGPIIFFGIGNIILGFVLFCYFLKKSFYIWKNRDFYTELPTIAFLCLAFIIPFTFVAFSLITKIPIMTIRFLLPCLVIRWGLLFKIIFGWKPRWNILRNVAMSFFIIYAIHQYMMYQQSRPYTAWKECTDSLSHKVKEKDIFIIGPGDIAPIFNYHWCTRLNHPAPPCIVTGSLYLTTDLLTYFIKHLPPEYNLWVLQRSEFGRISTAIIDEWGKNHLHYFTMEEYPPWEGLIYFGFSVKDNLNNPVNITNSESQFLEESKELAPQLKSCLESTSNILDMPILSRYDNPLEVIERGTYIQYTMDWLSIDRPCWPQTILKPALHIVPWIDFAYALSCLETNPEETENIFCGTKKSSRFFYNIMQPIWNAIKVKDYKAIELESEKVMNYGLWVGNYFNHFAKHRLKGSPCIFPMGCFPYDWDSENKMQEIILNKPNITNNEILETRYKQVIDIMKFKEEQQ